MKETFTIKKNGKEIKYAVVRPTPEDGRIAQLEYNKAFADALKSGALLRAKLDAYMREQGMWDDERESQYRALVKSINDAEYKLKQGGIRLSEARQLALEMRRKRNELRELIAERNTLDANTAEGQAENARFNCLVALCLRYDESGERVYKSTNDYLEHGTDDEAYRGAQVLANMLYALDKDFEKNLPENKFLKEYGFVDEELRLINKDGKLIDENGRLIDEQGRFVDEDGNLIDENGRRINDNGEYIVEFKPFLDDDGNPIIKQDDNSNSNSNNVTNDNKDNKQQDIDNVIDDNKDDKQQNNGVDTKT